MKYKTRRSHSAQNVKFSLVETLKKLTASQHCLRTIKPWSEDYQMLPTFIRDKSSQCRDHKKKIARYCSLHGCPCCVKCIADKHKKCKEIKSLSDIIKPTKSSAVGDLLEKDLKNVRDNWNHTIAYLKSRIEKNNIQKRKAIEKVWSIRKSIENHLNRFEQKMFDELESNNWKLNINMTSLVQQMEQ